MPTYLDFETSVAEFEGKIAELRARQDKLVYGSDCSDHEGSGPKCQGAQTIAAIRRLANNKTMERKLLYGNAKKLFRL